MSKPQNKHDATGVFAEIAGEGIYIYKADDTTAAGTVGYAPGSLLITTTTKKLYVNTGTLAAATWTVAGSQS